MKPDAACDDQLEQTGTHLTKQSRYAWEQPASLLPAGILPAALSSITPGDRFSMHCIACPCSLGACAMVTFVFHLTSSAAKWSALFWYAADTDLPIDVPRHSKQRQTNING
jgi:hypothetical protein